MFGGIEVGAIHGRLLTAWAAAGVAGPLIVNLIADSPGVGGQAGVRSVRAVALHHGRRAGRRVHREPADTAGGQAVPPAPEEPPARRADSRHGREQMSTAKRTPSPARSPRPRPRRSSCGCWSRRRCSTGWSRPPSRRRRCSAPDARSPPDSLVGVRRDPLYDGHGRRISDLRVSVTDRCNFRCQYCMPADGLPWLDREEILSFEEIERLVVRDGGDGGHRSAPHRRRAAGAQGVPAAGGNAGRACRGSRTSR